MKFCTINGDILSEQSSENYPSVIYCDECAAGLDAADQLIGADDFKQSAQDIEGVCSRCGKTGTEEQDEILANAIDDTEIEPDSVPPQDVYPTTVNVSPDDSSVFELKRQHEKGRINLAPKFQRHSVWSTKQKSELIESILMGIPLPIMYFFEDRKGVKQVIDGKQRLTTLFAFLNNEFALSELPVLRDLKGKRFNDLTGMQQGKIEDYKISINVIKPPTPDRIKFDIFDRVNRGGTRLNNQEMRNAIYQGQVTELLERLKDSESFKAATDHSIRSRVMKDRYVILRFLAFYLWRKELLIDEKGVLVDYKSDIDSFLGKTMEYLNICSGKVIHQLEDAFGMAMVNAFDILGKDGFRVSSYTFKERRTSVSMALFEVLSYLFTFKEVEANPELTKARVQQLFEDDEFLSAITTPVDSSIKVNQRFEKVEQLLQGLRC